MTTIIGVDVFDPSRQVIIELRQMGSKSSYQAEVLERLSCANLETLISTVMTHRQDRQPDFTVIERSGSTGRQLYAQLRNRDPEARYDPFVLGSVSDTAAARIIQGMSEQGMLELIGDWVESDNGALRAAVLEACCHTGFMGIER